MIRFESAPRTRMESCGASTDGRSLFAQQFLPVRDHAQRRAASVGLVQHDHASVARHREIRDSHADRLNRLGRFRRKGRIGVDSRLGLPLTVTERTTDHFVIAKGS